MSPTVEQLTAAMREAVAERGADFVYPKGQAGWTYNQYGVSLCRYVRSDVEEPACLIGVVLHKLGVSLGQLSGFEGDNSYAVVPALFPDSPLFLERALAAAQSAQDNGRTWGVALQRFLEALEG